MINSELIHIRLQWLWHILYLNYFHILREFRWNVHVIQCNFLLLKSARLLTVHSLKLHQICIKGELASKCVYRTWGVQLQMWEELYKAFCGSRGCCVKSDKCWIWAQNYKSGEKKKKTWGKKWVYQTCVVHPSSLLEAPCCIRHG